jgi:hypothetical protein
MNRQEYRREYYLKNKEAIQKKRKEKIYCKCCMVYIVKYNLKRHENSWEHIYLKN